MPDGGGVAALIAGAVAVVALVSLVPMIGGTSPHELIEGWVIRPSKTPGIQWDPLHVHPLSWVVAGAGLALALAVQLLRGRTLERGWHAALGAGRILAGLAIWVAVTGPIFHLPTHLTQGMVVGASLLWMAMLDPRGGSPQTSFLRVLIPALAALQFLQAYPIAGSQVFWSSLLLVIVGGIIVADGADQLATAGASWRPGFAASPALAAIPVALFIAWFCLKPLLAEVRRASDTYDAGVTLDLPGARDMRVSEPLALQLEQLTAAIRRHCDSFLTIPGMNSLNIFSGEEPPVEMPGPWPFFIDADEQQKIVDEVRKIPRFCVVAKPDLLEFWADDSGNVVPDRPLVRYMRDGFRLQRNFSGYYLLVRKGEG